MNYEQIDIALGFLDDDSCIVLQVPYFKDIELVRWHIIEKLKPDVKGCTLDTVTLTNNRTIYIDVFGSKEQSGYGVGAGKCFLIDRLNDRSYMDNLEVVGQCV